MPKYRYKAVDGQGREKNGQLDASSKAAAFVALKRIGLTPSAVEEAVSSTAVPSAAARREAGAQASTKSAWMQAGESAHAQAAAPRRMPNQSLRPARNTAMNRSLGSFLPRFIRHRVKRTQLMVFSRQLATLIDAHVPLLRALQILHKQEPHPGLREIIGEISESVEGGSTFAEALSQHPRVFDKLYVNMIKAGEIGGVMQVTLTRLTEFIEKAEKIRTRVRGAMIYPIVVLVVALGITSGMMVGIVPKFAEIFGQMLRGKELPAITQFVMGVSDFMLHQYYLLVGAIVVVIALFQVFGRTRFGRYQLDKLKLRAVIFGPLLMRVSVSRFTRTLGTLLASGVQILQALMIVRETSGNEVLARAILAVHDSIKEGDTMSGPLEQSGVFPSMVCSMIAVGEETGRLPDMLAKIADTYDTEVDSAVEGLTSIIEPVLIVFLAVVVGTVVIAMFMPLISLISGLQK